MICIEKDYDSAPEKLRSSECQDLIRQALAERNSHTFKSEYYHKGCIKKLEELYHCKCAYCETDSSAGAPFEIEHFRPKKKRANNQSSHRGYYWLGYEWSNLMLCCSWCNKKKGDKFPLSDESRRVHHPELSEDGLPTANFCQADAPSLIREKAQLLNPELDVVEDHFIFRPDGKIVSLSERGRATISTLKLNRERLVFRRKKLVEDYFNDVEAALANFVKNELNDIALERSLDWLFKKLITYQQPSQEYSRLGYFMFVKFDLFAEVHLEAEERDFVIKAFKNFTARR